MNFNDEHYVRVFTRDTKTWLKWGFEGQTTFLFLLRKLDKAGVLDDVADLVDDVAIVIGVPRELVAIGVPRLIESGTLVHRNQKLVMPNYLTAQTSRKSDAARAKDCRARRRASALDESQDVTAPSQNVTLESQNVTERHDASHDVTERHVDVTLRAPAHAHAHAHDVVLFDSVREGGAGGRDPIEVQAVTRWEVAKAYPVQQRAEWLVAQRHGQEHYSPSKWPEVVKAWEAYQEADGKPGARLGAWDKSTQAIVALYAAGHEQSTVCAGIRAVVKSEWWLKLQADGKRPGVGWISTEVFNRAMTGATDALAPQELAKLRLAKTRENDVATLNAGIERTANLMTRDDIKWLLPAERAQALAELEAREAAERKQLVM